MDGQRAVRRRGRLNVEQEAALLFGVAALAIALTLAGVARWQPPEAPPAIYPTIPAANVAARTADLDRLMHDTYGGGGDTNRQRSWYPHIKAYRLDGNTLVLDTDYPAGGVSPDIVASITYVVLNDMHYYGDPVDLAIINDAAGQRLLTVPYSAIIRPVGT